MTDSHSDFETRAVQAGLRSAQDFRPTAPAIYPSTTYVYDDAAAIHAALDPMVAEGFAYSRNANPTVRMLEEAMASLEETEDAVAFSSGMAAVHAAVVATGIRPGQSIVAAESLYGGSRNLLATLFGQFGVELSLVDVSDLDAVDEVLAGAKAGALIFEPISNPLLKVAPVRRLVNSAHTHGVPVIVDNTFVSPYLFRPATLDADFVVESLTKYIGGHGDVTAGAVACSAERAFAVRAVRTSAGGVLSAFDSWLALRGVKTLAVRMPRHCENALALAEWLKNRPGVHKVNYPGLRDHPGFELVGEQFGGSGGGMVSFDTPFGFREAETFLNALKLAVPGTSLGDVETLVLHPAQSSHRSLTPDQRAEAGIGDGLIRVSVGLESARDIIADFDQALNAVYTPIARQPVAVR